MTDLSSPSPCQGSTWSNVCHFITQPAHCSWLNSCHCKMLYACCACQLDDILKPYSRRHKVCCNRVGILQVEEDNNADVEGSSATDASSSASSQPESEGGKFAPKETFEDGSVMYAAADLEAVDYEAVLAP